MNEPKKKTLTIEYRSKGGEILLEKRVSVDRGTAAMLGGEGLDSRYAREIKARLPEELPDADSVRLSWASKQTCKDPCEGQEDKWDVLDDKWDVLDKVEESQGFLYQMGLAMLWEPIRDCYTCCIQAPLLGDSAEEAPDHQLWAAVFLKRTVTDLRGVWNLASTGYTSQSAVLAASLFEHSLASECLSRFPELAAKMVGHPLGAVPWGVLEMCRKLVESKKPRDEDPMTTHRHLGNLYCQYKLLCKIKHPTLRSTVPDTDSTRLPGGNSYVVSALPKASGTQLSLATWVLSVSIMRSLCAAERFVEATKMRNPDVDTGDFDRRSRAVGKGIKDALGFAKENLPPPPISMAAELREWTARAERPEGASDG